jgi:cell division protein FtsB
VVRARRVTAPRLPRRISGRAATLALVLLALVFAYAYPVRVYLAQQADLRELSGEQQAQQSRIEDLAARLARWEDESFIRAEARRRLHYVRKGELFYVVGTDPAAGGPGAEPPAGQSGWVTQLWTSVQAVDNPPVP